MDVLDIICYNKCERAPGICARGFGENKSPLIIFEITNGIAFVIRIDRVIAGGSHPSILTGAFPNFEFRMEFTEP